MAAQGKCSMKIPEWAQPARFILGGLLAPAIWVVAFYYGLDKTLTWFRPNGSNMAIGLFAVMTMACALLLAYPIAFLCGGIYVSRLLEQGRLNLVAIAGRAFFMGLGFSLLPSGFCLVATEYALSAALALVSGLAAVFASVCFYIVSCVGSTVQAPRDWERRGRCG